VLGGCTSFGDEKRYCASSDKDQFAQEWLEKASRLNEQFEIMF